MAEILLHCKKIEVLICMEWEDAEYFDGVPLIDDVRFVFMGLSASSYERDWEIGARGGIDFWQRADKFVAKKRRGEIKPSLFSPLDTTGRWDLISSSSTRISGVLDPKNSSTDFGGFDSHKRTAWLFLYQFFEESSISGLDGRTLGAQLHWHLWSQRRKPQIGQGWEREGGRIRAS
ncbi:hypothetical protein DFH07DRAFT_777145 [Mycena maculata]|uniref:Uncharacterized protein n=1 Tax=Mycena maculata TaxID=230809 RepID=A0AAD7N3S7_9AGAR|nr:hypothetical protein DFH07DRAFT_777145 [Mycena maculata]